MGRPISPQCIGGLATLPSHRRRARRAATIEPFDLLEHEAHSGSEIAIQFELLAEPPEKFELHGAVRHRTRTAEGRIRLGVELENLTPHDVILLDLISRRLDSFI